MPRDGPELHFDLSPVQFGAVSFFFMIASLTFDARQHTTWEKTEMKHAFCRTVALTGGKR